MNDTGCLISILHRSVFLCSRSIRSMFHMPELYSVLPHSTVGCVKQRTLETCLVAQYQVYGISDLVDVYSTCLSNWPKIGWFCIYWSIWALWVQERRITNQKYLKTHNITTIVDCGACLLLIFLLDRRETGVEGIQFMLSIHPTAVSHSLTT